MRLFFACTILSALVFSAHAQNSGAHKSTTATGASTIVPATPGQFATVLKHGDQWYSIRSEALKGIDPTLLVTMEVVGPEEGEELFGETGKNGAMVYVLKEALTQEWVDGLAIRAQIMDFYAVPMYLSPKDFGPDGKVKQPQVFYAIKTENAVVKVSHDFLMTLSPAVLKSVEILRGEAGVAKFGEAASQGAILVKLKEEQQGQILKNIK